MKHLVSVAALLAAAGSAAHAQTNLPQANDAYFRAARSALQERLRVTPNTGQAKNVILFVGDGMGISTVTAGRIYEGQKRGVDGESNALTMERLPYAALSKTYTHDAQVADSAPTAVAMVTGVKTRNDVIGVNSEVAVGDCAGSKGKEVATPCCHGGTGRAGDRDRFNGPDHPCHARGHVRAHPPPRLGGRRQHAARGHRRRVQGHRAAACRLAAGRRLRGDLRRRSRPLPAEHDRTIRRIRTARARARTAATSSRSGRTVTEQRRLRVEQGPASTGSTRRPPTCSGSSSARTCATRPTASRTTAASRRSPR